MKNLRYIKDLIFRYKYRYIIGILFLISVDTLQLIFPKILGFFTDDLKGGGITDSKVLYYAIIIALIAVGIALFRFLWRYFIFGVSRKIEKELRNRFYEHLQKLSVNYYNNHKTGDLLAHSSNDIANVQVALGQGITMSLDSLLIPVVSIILMIGTAGFKLTLICFLPLALLGLIISLNVKFMHSKIEKMQEAFSQLTETARENFSGIRVVKSFVQEQKEMAKFIASNKYNKEMNLIFVRNTSLLFPIVMSVSTLTFAIALWYGGSLVISGEITLGSFIAFNGYLLTLTWPIAALGWVTSLFQRGFVSLKRINAILDEKPEIEDSQDIVQISKVEGKIVFNNLNFTYPGHSSQVLKNINITLEKGKTLAIVGRTGSGKTTLINLIVRLYNVGNGQLLVDDIDINRVPLSVLRESIGFVPQDTFLFSATIKENIDFFLGNDDSSIEKASKTSKVYDDIKEFPKGFDTIVGERGVTLSGGQKQRISIARAILRSPSILILDDCLSAVDTNTEEEILKGLKEVMQERTSIIVSHRISTIKDADEIIFLDEGEIIERGTHETLLELQGQYYELYQKQLLADQLAKED